MSSTGNNRNRFIELAVLVLILAFTFLITFSPHLGYPYPIHHDEWMHIANSEAIVESHSISYVDPFYGQWLIQRYQDSPENAFYILFALIHQITGISIIDLFVYLPAVIFTFAVLAVYLLAAKEGFGLEAAFFTSLVPTSIGLLGPVFMVPLSLGIFIIPLMLFFVFNARSRGNYPALFLLICFLILIHPPSAAIAIVLIIPYILLSIRENIRHSIYVFLSLAIPLLIILVYLIGISSVEMSELSSSTLSTYIRFPDIIQTYGLLPIAFSFLGIIAIFITAKANNLGLLFGLIALLLVLFVFFRLGIGSSIIYERGLVYLQLILGIVAGAGLFWMRSLKLRAKSPGIAAVAGNLGNILCIVFVFAILIIAIPGRINAGYYRMIDDKDYSSFAWIKEHLDPGYDVFLVDPWKATAFSAVTERHTIRRIFKQREPIDDKLDLFLQAGCPDSTILRDNRISVVYNRYDCNNPDLNKIKDDIYLVNSLTRNKLLNAGFEGIVLTPPKPWVTWSENCKPQFLFPVPGINNGQGIGIQLSVNTYDPWPQAMWSQEVSVKPGSRYYIGGWVKTDDITGIDGARILVYWRGENWEAPAYTEFMKKVRGTTGWTFYEGTVTAPPQATRCNVICIMAGCSGRAAYDNLVFNEK